MAQQYASGWENPDHHPDATQRPRPMFDATGRAVDKAPPPEPAPELAAFASPVNPDLGGLTDSRRLARIRDITRAALEAESSAVWVAALVDISRELDR